RPLFVIASDVGPFLNRVFDRFESAGAYTTFRNKPIDDELLLKDWNRLKAMDSHGLKHFLFSAKEDRIQWSDITSQAFFAAWWACRWATDRDRRRMRDWVVDSLSWRRLVYAEFWRFAAEMPGEVVDLQRWIDLMGLLYDPATTDRDGRPFRSTEF